jgi:hypothetical protein
MRLSDAGLRRRPTKLIYTDHRPTPWLSEAAPRDRSNRLLDPTGAAPQLGRTKSLEAIHLHPSLIVFIGKRAKVVFPDPTSRLSEIYLRLTPENAFRRWIPRH